MTLALIDTHAHLDDDRFRLDLSEILNNARAAGVSRILSIATTAASAQANVALAAKHDTLFASVGIQPNHVAQAEASDWDLIVHLVDQPRVKAIGETGLDRHWNDTPFGDQEDYFARHLKLARQKQLPVVIHCREAEADVLRMLREDYDRHGQVCGVMHSFTGDWATAEACLAMGLDISFAGMVTFKNAADLRAVAAKVPLDRIVVETDSPYLAPVPVRGKRNEPAFVVHTAACLAGVHGLEVTQFARQTTQNATRLFQLPAS